MYNRCIVGFNKVLRHDDNRKRQPLVKMMLLSLRQPSWILAARSKTVRDTAWQTTKINSAQKNTLE